MIPYDGSDVSFKIWKTKIQKVTETAMILSLFANVTTTGRQPTFSIVSVSHTVDFELHFSRVPSSKGQI